MHLWLRCDFYKDLVLIFMKTCSACIDGIHGMQILDLHQWLLAKMSTIADVHYRLQADFGLHRLNHA